MKKRGRALPFAGLLIATILLAAGARADMVLYDDLIVDGSACIGEDCVNGESFGFVDLRLKENILRIGFMDTSHREGYPSNDWQITVNDSERSGADKFSIDDTTGGKTPFTIRAGARTHSLYIDERGHVGFGTSVPGKELHVVDGDSPTLRLEQDGSGTFEPHVWEVGGNESWFYINDATLNDVRMKIAAASGDVTVRQNLTVEKDLTVSGTKNFAMADPEDPGTWIYFSALEGPEAGTYYRGVARTAAGTAVVELPHYFEKVTEAEGLTVHITPLGGWGRLYVAELDPGRLVVREADGADGIAFSFLVQGVRRGRADFRVERPAPRGGG